MRKNSAQILKEFYLDRALESFPHIKELRQAIDDLLNFRANELDALHTAVRLTKDEPELSAWVADKILEHSRRIQALLGMTLEGYKDFIKLMEDSYSEYTEIRNKARKQVDSQPAEKLH